MTRSGNEAIEQAASIAETTGSRNLPSWGDLPLPADTANLREGVQAADVQAAVTKELASTDLGPGVRETAALSPENGYSRLHALTFSGGSVFGLAAAEKGVHRVYETKVRPPESRDPGWLRRVEGQIRDTFGELEKRVPSEGDWLCGDAPTQADVTVAVAWRFIHATAPGLVADSDYPQLAALSAQAEALPAFMATRFE